MPSVHDTAAYIIERLGEVPPWKLEKLVFYAFAWHLAWTEEPLFKERYEAWAQGPACPALYNVHHGNYDSLTSWPKGRAERLTPEQRESIDQVLESYGPLTTQQLSHLMRYERPWMEAREGLDYLERSNRAIDTDTIYDFYAGLDLSQYGAIKDIDWDAVGI